ncbi:MAG: VWA domain-containing protein [Rhodospirillaceae bacterium]|nr:VWA domain-containing protein [Rhodospirillaceae bacterium]
MPTSSLPNNVMHFARVLRRAGLPIGPGKVIAALQALPLINITNKDDVYWTLHSVFVDRHAHSEMFRLAFAQYWRAQDDAPNELSLIDQAQKQRGKQDLKTMPRRIAEAFANAIGQQSKDEDQSRDQDVPETVASWSAAEKLRSQDFETMSAEEMAEAKRLMAALRLPIPRVNTRRFASSSHGTRIDVRASLRASLATGDLVYLKRRARTQRHPPLVVLCDISGSMAAYARMLLHFLHAITNDRDRVHVFLFGTRLTNVTRELAHRDPDVALARVGRSVQDWSGGTRIGQALGQFNHLWSRRVLGQGAVTLLITDGLDRDAGEGLAAETRRLQRSCRRLIWLNPLLRYAGFEPKSAGIRAMLPHVDEFRPVHNLDSLAALIAALSEVSAARREFAAVAA